MPLWKTWKEDGGLWAIWHVTETMEMLQAGLTDVSVREECGNLKAPSRKMEFLAVRTLLKAVAGRELQIEHAPSGKPFLKNGPWNISISHTKNYVAIGLHESAVLGVDIEQYGEKVRRVESRFVRSDEMSGRADMERTEELYQLLLHWSAKESMFKVMNCTEVDFLQHLKVLPFHLESSGTVRGEAVHPDYKGCFRIHYLTHPDFVCTYCVEK